MKIFNLSIIIALSILVSHANAGFAQPVYDSPEERKHEAIRLYNQSIKPLIDGDYAKALELLKAACELNDSQPLIQNNYGLALLKIGKTDEALAHFLKASSCENAPIMAWLNLGNAYETGGQYEKAIESFEKYLAGAPTSADATKIRAHLELLKKEFLTVNQSTSPANREDYLDAATRKVKLRWPLSSMPIKVYMEQGDDIPGFKPEYAELLKQAFDDWQSAASGKISIVFVNDKKKADITTRWSNDLKQIVSAAEGGDAKYHGTSKGLTNVSITLLTVDPSSTTKLTANTVSWITHHEVGHALGLLGHSPDSKDIMYFCAPHADKPAALSDRDARTIVKLYSVDL
jgi:tetratricopeptide (TPR) repeat protein